MSVATASVAITRRPSGNCRVSAEVAEKIRAAARELNYRPNIQARNLSTQRTHAVAMVIERAAWHGAIFYVSAMQRVLRARGYAETFMLNPDNRLDTERDQLERCIERRVEGIIAMPVIDLDGRTNAELFNQIQQEECIPVVHLGIGLPGCVAPAITTDDVEGVRRAVRLLHAMGHRRIVHATIPRYDDPTPLNPFKQAHLRYVGYAEAMQELGLAPQVLQASGDFADVESLYDSGRALARTLVDAAAPMRTAVISFADCLAAGLIAGFRDAGVDVPGQLSVLGVGDQPIARMLCPALSTLAPPFERLGELATQTLLNMIEGRPGESAQLAPSLVERATLRAIEPG